MPILSSESPQKPWKRDSSFITSHFWSTKAGILKELHTRGNISATFHLGCFKTATSITSCLLLHPSQWFVLIPSPKDTSLWKITHVHSLKKNSLLQKNLLKLLLGEARLREFVSLFHWPYLPWALLRHMDNLLASFLGLMNFKEYILIALMPLVAWLFGLLNCVWHIFNVLLHLSHLKTKP